LESNRLILDELEHEIKGKVEDEASVQGRVGIGNNVVIKKGEIENSILMDNCLVDIDEKITDSIIGPYSVIAMNKKGQTKGLQIRYRRKVKITIWKNTRTNGFSWKKARAQIGKCTIA